MKKILSPFIILFSLVSGYVQGQHLAPSTVRQVFSFDKGDTLEYHEWSKTLANGCGVLCNMFILDIIDSTYYNTTNDTLTVLFNARIMHLDTLATSPSSGCGVCHTTYYLGDYFSVLSGKWVITHLDSSIFYLMDTTYGMRQGYSIDTSYKVPSQYNGGKQNKFGYYSLYFSDFTEIYADSVGIVYKTEVPQAQPFNTEQLTYYHKVNGKKWGEPFFYSGIAMLPAEEDISIYPNPVENNFMVHSNIYHNVNFEVFNVLGEKVLSDVLLQQATPLTRHNLPAGIYYWRATNNNSVIKTGKLIFN